LSKSAENLNNFALVKILEETLVIATGAVVGKGDQPFRVWLITEKPIVRTLILLGPSTCRARVRFSSCILLS